MEVFTEEWSRACCESLNRHPGFREAAAEWTGAMVLVMERDAALGVEEERAVYLDLHRGECRGTRAAAEEELARAPYVMRAAPTVWRQVLAGELDPVSAVMQGKLRLARGNALALARYASAAREVMAAAAAVDATFPPPRM